MLLALCAQGRYHNPWKEFLRDGLQRRPMLVKVNLRFFYQQPVPSGLYTEATCTSLPLTVLPRDRTLKLLIRGAKFRLDLLRSRKDVFISVAP